MDGFNCYNEAADLSQTYSTSNCDVSTNSGRFGGGALQLGNNNAKCTYIFNSPQTEIWTGFPINFYMSGYENCGLLIFNSSSGIEATITLSQTNGTFQVYNGQQSTLLGTSSVITTSPDVWHYIEVHYLISSTVGIFEIWYDSIRILNLTNINTTKYSSTMFDSISFGTYHNDNKTPQVYICDWYILNTTGIHNTKRLGDSRIFTLSPISDADPNDGVPALPGPNYIMINGPRWKSSNSITLTNTFDQTEMYDMSSVPLIPPIIYGIQVVAIAEKTDVGDITARTLLSSNNNLISGSNTALLTSLIHLSDIFEVDPNTNNSWTVNSTNSIQCGFKIII
jgi:hypothetical protein